MDTVGRPYVLCPFFFVVIRLLSHSEKGGGFKAAGKCANSCFTVFRLVPASPAPHSCLSHCLLSSALSRIHPRFFSPVSDGGILQWRVFSPGARGSTEQRFHHRHVCVCTERCLSSLLRLRGERPHALEPLAFVGTRDFFSFQRDLEVDLS